jgi:hypothetical protein
VLLEPDDFAPYATHFWGQHRGLAACVVRPGITAEMADVVKLTARAITKGTDIINAMLHIDFGLGCGPISCRQSIN